MKTIVTDSTDEAAQIISRGGISAFPTETVYGLGADIRNEDAIRKVFSAKGRPGDNPLIAHVSDVGDIDLLSEQISDYARALVRVFFPGPLTIVVAKSGIVPMIATAGLETIGIRMPDHPTALELISKSGSPLVAPSANLSGRPSPTTWQAVLEDMDGHIDCILKGEPTRHGLESTVVDCTGERPLILREGSVTYEELIEVTPDITRISNEFVGAPKSPGLKHKHYSPSAAVALYGENLMTFERPFGYIGLETPTEEFEKQLVCNSVAEYASSLFEFFRQCDRDNIQTIFCQSVKETGLGVALMDRINRAAKK